MISNQNQTEWVPIKGHETFLINQHGHVKNKRGRILKFRSRRENARVDIWEDNVLTKINICETLIETFGKSDIKARAELSPYMHFKKGNFFREIANFQAGNYSELEVIFQLEIKAKKC